MKIPHKYFKGKSFLVILVLVGMSVSFWLGMFVQKNANESGSFVEINGSRILSTDSGNIDITAFIKAYNILNDKFVSTTASSTIPTDKEKIYGAIQGLATAYGDPYTVFFPPEESKQFEEEVRGDFSGIGLEIGIKNNLLVAISPLKGTPAERAGIKPGNIILKIDTLTTQGMSVDEAVKHIRGPKGTLVTLTVKDGENDSREVPIYRDIINLPVIDTKLRDDGIFVISLYNFSSNSSELFRQALREFVLSGSDKLILDLRSNPGGYLESAIDMASWFLPIGKTIVIEDAGGSTKQEILRSKGYDIFNDNLKMIVLIDGGSASASEILAGALHEHGVAELVGEKSFGKGSVQELLTITPETTLKVTVARWLTPDGVSISQNGLEPDIKVKFREEDIKNKYDRQMETAAEMLKNN